MAKPAFETVWERIKQYQGETFILKRGKGLKYVVFEKQGQECLFHNAVEWKDEQDWSISKAELEEAYKKVPTKYVQDMGMRNSYKWAILHDPRIIGWLD